MNAVHRTTIGLASIVALGVFALPMMKGRDASASLPQKPVIAQVQPLTSPETPQSEQSDMAYGDRTPQR